MFSVARTFKIIKQFLNFMIKRYIHEKWCIQNGRILPSDVASDVVSITENMRLIISNHNIRGFYHKSVGVWRSRVGYQCTV